MYKFADKLERLTFVNGGVQMVFVSYNVSSGVFDEVVRVRVSLERFLQTYGVMKEFFGKLETEGVITVTEKSAEAEVGVVPESESDAVVAPETEVKPRRKAKRRKAATEK